MPPLQAGQLWRYQTRPGEEESRLLILKVAPMPNAPRETVVHIRVLDVCIRNPQSDSGFSTEIGHTPILKTPLLTSLTALEQEHIPIPQDTAAPIQDWERQAAAGHAGAFSVTVAELVEGMEQAINAAKDRLNA